jgi:hypothetical protein
MGVEKHLISARFMMCPENCLKVVCRIIQT